MGRHAALLLLFIDTGCSWGLHYVDKTLRTESSWTPIGVAAPGPTPPASSPAGPALTHLSFAVLPTSVEGRDANVPDLLDDYVLTAVQNATRGEVIGQDDITAMLGFEKQRDLLGCEETVCFADIGGALGVERLLAMRIARVADEWVVTGKVIDPGAAAVSARESRMIGGGTGVLLRSIPALVRELIRQAGGAR